jgi:hypothetical protein
VTIDTSKLKVSTKALVVGFLSLGGLATVPAVNAPLTAFLNAHHSLAPIVSTLVAVWTVLHNPVVQDALGIKRTVEVKETTEEVVVKPDAAAAKDAK